MASRIFTWLMFSLISLSVFVVIRQKYGVWNAVIGALIYIFVPIVFWQGIESYTRGFSVIFFPLAFYLVNSLLEKQDKIKIIILLAFVIALTILTHPMMGMILVIFFTFYLFIRLILDINLKKFSIFLWFFAVFLGLGLISWYLLPYFGESRGWSSLPSQLYKAYTPELTKQVVLLSVSLFIFSIFSIWFNRTKERLAIFITALISMFFALGSYLPIVPQLPLISQIYPLVILMFTGFLFSYLVATAIDFESLSNRLLPKQKILQPFLSFFIAFIIISLPFLESAAFNKIFQLKSLPISSFDKKIAGELEAYPNDGRVIPMKYPFSALWTVPEDARKAMVEGHYNSATPMGKQIAWLYDALDNRWYDYTFKKLSLWNTRFILKTEHLSPYLKFLSLLKKANFDRVHEGVMGQGYDLYFKNKPSDYLIPLKEKFLVVGKYAMVASSIIDSSVQGGSIYIDDYDLQTLKLFDGLILYGFTFRDKGKAEALVSKYAESGGNVIIDMLGYVSPLEEHPSFMGVTAYDRFRNKPMIFDVAQNSIIKAEDIPLRYKLPSYYVDLKKKKFKEWRFVTYFGLDNKVATIRRPLKRNGFANVAIGYKQIKGQKIWFIGPNFFYHTFASHNRKQIRFLNTLLKTDEERLKPKFDYQIFEKQSKPELIRFSYKAKQDLPLFVSFTHSPHWKAYLDNKPLEVINLEDLIFLQLPAGKHKVLIKYENTPIHSVGKGLTILALLFIGGLIYNEKYNFRLWGSPKRRPKPKK